MKNNKLILIPFFVTCFGCNPSKNIASVTEGVYVYTKIFPEGNKDECIITLLNNKQFEYTCTYHHFGTKVSGTWHIIESNRVVINVEKEDILPTYPEKFYNKIDTIYLLSDTSIISYNRVFYLKKK